MGARIDTNRGQSVPPANRDEPIATTRVDLGHAIAGDAGAASSGGASSVAMPQDDLRSAQAKDDVHTMVGALSSLADEADEQSQVDAHARQLGRELDARQTELDRREEELNRRLAEFDQEMRRSRIWLEERRREIEEREVEIGARRADVEARFERIVANERELLAARRSKRDNSDVAGGDRDDLSVPESAFEPCPQEIDVRAADGIAVDVEDRAARVRRLEESEALLAAEQQAMAEARGRLESDRAAAKEAAAAERCGWSEERGRQQAALGRRHETLRQRAAQLDARAESLEQLRGDLTAAQRETLEMRVAVQELWLQLSGRAAPATMLQSLAEARARLAAQYRDAGGAFDAAEKRLRAAAEELAGQLAQIKEQRRQFQSWADERQQAIERQAARLVAREQELDAQDQGFRSREQTWSEQRLAYRRQIRRLLAELRAGERSTDVTARF